MFGGRRVKYEKKFDKSDLYVFNLTPNAWTLRFAFVVHVRTHLMPVDSQLKRPHHAGCGIKEMYEPRVLRRCQPSGIYLKAED